MVKHKNELPTYITKSIFNINLYKSFYEIVIIKNVYIKGVCVKH